MALDNMVDSIMQYLKSEGHNVDDQDRLVIRRLILQDRRREDHEDDEWTMVYRFQRAAKDSPSLKIPEGYVLDGWLTYTGGLVPDRKFGVYPHFVRDGDQVSV